MRIPSKEFSVTTLSTLEKYYWVFLGIEEDAKTLKSKYLNEIFLENYIVIHYSSNLPLSDWIHCLAFAVCVCCVQSSSLNMKMQCTRRGCGTTKRKSRGRRPQPSWSCLHTWTTPSGWWQRTAWGGACPVRRLNSIWPKLQVKLDFCGMK